MLISKIKLRRGIRESAASFTMAHLCHLGPQDRMNWDWALYLHVGTFAGLPSITAGIYILVQWHN
jgi:hypothetical protein